MLIYFILMSICVFNFSLALLSCPFQSCQTVKGISSCSIDCELADGQFPSMGNQTIKFISEMVLKNLSSIPDDAFTDLDITSLSINGSNLQNVSENAFRKNKKIRRLLMSGLKSPEVIPDKSLEYLENSTKSLVFSDNHLNLETLNQHLKKFNYLKNLQYLNLQNNRLYRFYSDLSNFANLNYLDLENNSIFDLNITANLTNLQLSNNKMIELTRNMFKNLKFLTCLNISNNLVESLGTGIFSDLKQLNELYLKNNRIQIIEPDWIHPNNGLQMLDLSNNLIDSFSIKNFINLKYLNLSRNKIKYISDIRPNTKLLSVDISQNLFESLPLELGHLSENSETINLSQNRIKSLDILKNMNCSKLKYFDASHNLIELIVKENFQKCASLKHLVLSNNRIRIMEFSYLENLSLLDVQNNHLVYLSRATLINLPNLEKFYASNNKILVLDSSTFNNNSKLIELHLDRNHLSRIPNISKLFRLEVLNLENQNGMLSQLTNFAFEKEINFKERSRYLLINIGKNKITKFEDKLFCSRYQNVIDLKRVTLIIDSIDSMNKCTLKQLSQVETIIYANNDQKCSLIQNRISNPDGHINIGCDISSLTSECFDQRFRCDYLRDFGKKNFTTWLSGDLHLYSFDNLYETCYLEGEHLCFSLAELSIYCYFESQNGTYQMKKIKIIYAGDAINYVYSADENSFSQGFNNYLDRLKKFQVDLNFFPPDHKIVLDRMKNIEISVLKDDFYTLLIRTSQDNFKDARGILKYGCSNKSNKLARKFRFMGTREKNNIFKIARNLGINFRDEKFFTDLNDEREILLTTLGYNFTDYLKQFTDFEQKITQISYLSKLNLKIPIGFLQQLNCSQIKIKNLSGNFFDYNIYETEIFNYLNHNWFNLSNLNSLVTGRFAEKCFLASQDNKFIYSEENTIKCFGISDSSQLFCLKPKSFSQNASTSQITKTTEPASNQKNEQLLETTLKDTIGNSRRSKRPNPILQNANKKPTLEENLNNSLNESLTSDLINYSNLTDSNSSITNLKTTIISITTSNFKSSSVNKERIVKNPVWTTYSSTSFYRCSDAERKKYSSINFIFLLIFILFR